MCQIGRVKSTVSNKNLVVHRSSRRIVEKFAVGQAVKVPSPGIRPTILGQSADIFCDHMVSSLDYTRIKSLVH